ncbi:hypothetical protein Zmor_010803 [Zophobas morio]|uniref:Tyr recombinase domain-containing protein n=1 Tax=Zophobas morio TaxID=2755281 RepID=A0AA38ISB9_9CUCU|nr:hypothetical protein Zmor_010803 [Zophobas morio]
MCTRQTVGKNTFLNLENAKEYTDHCLRGTAATLLVEAGASFETLKLHGKWKSTTVAEGYFAEYVASKNKTANLVANSSKQRRKIIEKSYAYNKEMSEPNTYNSGFRCYQRQK